MKQCRTCQAEIEWRTHPQTGKPHPYNAGTQQSHFATCIKPEPYVPQPPKLRTPRKPPPAEQLTLFDVFTDQ